MVAKSNVWDSESLKAFLLKEQFELSRPSLLEKELILFKQVTDAMNEKIRAQIQLLNPQA
jgi:hypothetical protein